MELCVADMSRMQLWGIYQDQRQAEYGLAKANLCKEESTRRWIELSKEYPEREYYAKCLEDAENIRYQIIPYDDFNRLEREKLLSGELEEITEERFNDMLNVLPPLKWCTISGVEMFCMSEMYTGTYTSQYAHDHSTGKFYTKMVDCADPETWIHIILKNNEYIIDI